MSTTYFGWKRVSILALYCVCATIKLSAGPMFVLQRLRRPFSGRARHASVTGSGSVVSASFGQHCFVLRGNCGSLLCFARTLASIQGGNQQVVGGTSSVVVSVLTSYVVDPLMSPRVRLRGVFICSSDFAIHRSFYHLCYTLRQT